MDCSPPWDFPGKTTGLGCHFLLQEIFPIQRLNRVSCIVGRWFTVLATREVPRIKQIYNHIGNNSFEKGPENRASTVEGERTAWGQVEEAKRRSHLGWGVTPQLPGSTVRRISKDLKGPQTFALRRDKFKSKSGTPILDPCRGEMSPQNNWV